MACADCPRAGRHDVAHALLWPDARRRGHPTRRLAHPRWRTKEGGIVRAMGPISRAFSSILGLILLPMLPSGAASTTLLAQTPATTATPAAQAALPRVHLFA